MKKIFKYQFPITDEFTLNLPIGAQPITVAEQSGVPYMWAIVDPDEILMMPYEFFVIGTGHPMPDAPLIYVGTIHESDRPLVWHIFMQGIK